MTPSAPVNTAGAGSGWQTPGQPAPPAHPSGGGGGILGALGDVGHWVASKAGKAGADIKAIPGGVAQLGEAEYGVLDNAVHHFGQSTKAGFEGPTGWGALVTHPVRWYEAETHPAKGADKAAQLVAGTLKGTEQALAHPARDPFATATTLLPLTHGLGRVADVADVLPKGPRALRINEGAQSLEASSHPIVRAVQAAHDAVVQKAIDERPDSRLAKYGAKRISGALQETQRARERMLSVLPKQLQKLGQGLGKEEQHALRLVSEGNTPEQAAAFHLRQAEAGVSPAENGAAAQLAQKVAKAGYITTDKLGHPVIDAERYPKLAAVDDKLAQAQAAADKGLQAHGVMNREALNERINMPSRIRTEGQFSALSDAQLTKRLGHLEARYNGLVDQVAAGEKVGSLRGIAAAENRLSARVRAQGVTPTEQLRAYAESKLQQTLRAHPDDPAVKSLAAELAEADQLRAELSRRADLAFDGEQPAAAEGRGYVPYRAFEPKAPKNGMARAVGPVVGEARSPISKTQKFEGVNLAHGRIPDDTTGLVAKHLRAVNRYTNTNDFRNALTNFGSPFRRSDRDILVRVPGEGSGTLSEDLKAELGQQRSTLDTVDTGENATHDAFVRRLFPGLVKGSDESVLEENAARGTEAAPGTVWIDSGLIHNMLDSGAGPKSWIGRTADNVNAAVTQATVYLKPGHFPTRFLTNAATNLMQGSLRPRVIANAVRIWQALSAQDRMRALALAGTHYSEMLPGAEGETVMARMVQRGLPFTKSAVGSPQWWAHYIDAPSRFNSIVFEAAREGYTGTAGVRRFLNDAESYTELRPALRAKVDNVIRGANREAIAYDRLNPTEKRVLARAVWFYPWVKGSTAFTVRSMLEHPYKFGALNAAGFEAQQNQRHVLGDLPSYERGLIPLGEGEVTDPSTFSPFSTAGDVVELLQHPGDASGNLNPAARALLDVGTGTANGNKTTHPIGAAIGELLGIPPEGQLVRDYLNRNKDQSGHMFQHTYVGDLLRGLLGPAVPRHINDAAANEAAARERSGR